MCPILTTKNVIDNLLLSYLYNIGILKRKCLEFLTPNCVDVIKRKDEWKHLVVNGSPQIFADLFLDLAATIHEQKRTNQQQERAIETLSGNQANNLGNGGHQAESNPNRIMAAKILGWTTLAILSTVVLALQVFIGFIIANGVPGWMPYLTLCIVFLAILITMCFAQW